MSLSHSELGAHIDGYIGTAAHTTVVNVDPSQPVTGSAADVICAAYYTQEAVLRMMKPGTTVRISKRTMNLYRLNKFANGDHCRAQISPVLSLKLLLSSVASLSRTHSLHR